MSENAPLVAPEIAARLTLLTADQVCDLLQVAKDWLYDVCQKDKFPHVKVGRQLRFRPTDVEAYINGTWERPRS